MSKDYQSIFVPHLEIDAANFITESIIANKIEWWQKRGKKIDKPRCAFWQKDIQNNSPHFKSLAKDYMVEIGFVKKLLKCFLPITIISYVKERGIVSFIYLPLDKQKTCIYNIWQLDIKKRKLLLDNKKQPKIIVSENTNIQNRESMPTKISKIL